MCRKHICTQIKKRKDMTMAGINGFGANFNRGINVGGLNQAGNAKNTQQAKNELSELKLNTNQVDGFVRTNNEVQEAKKDDKPKEGGDGAKKGFWERFREKMDQLKEDAAMLNQDGPNGGTGQDLVFLGAALIYACGVDF